MDRFEMSIIQFLELVQEETGLPHWEAYRNFLKLDQRVGQAFFNALAGSPYAGQLRGTIYDPFYKDSLFDVYKAIDFLWSK